MNNRINNDPTLLLYLRFSHLSSNRRTIQRQNKSFKIGQIVAAQKTFTAVSLVTLQCFPTFSAVSSSASVSELEGGSDEEHKLNLSLIENFFMVKSGLQQGNSAQDQRSLPREHLDMVVIYTSGHQNNKENALLAFDFLIKESGFNVSTTDRTDVCKPLFIQVMWSSCKCFTSPVKWHRSTTISLGMALIWVTYYERCISFEQSYINEQNTMDDLEFIRPDSPALFVKKPTERERNEHLIKARLQSIMMIHDLEKM